ncbi:MAG: helix-turn-helix domain-containing protein [Planctomycetia bacterium]|nr:helix-turn-helix domain-containing protein [Planctomycetia bacterium]
MAQVKTLSEWMAVRGIGLAELVETSGVEERVVEAIANGRYTPSPDQRQRLSAVLGVSVEEIAWGHVTQVSHVYGHGPQFGRSP